MRAKSASFLVGSVMLVGFVACGGSTPPPEPAPAPPVDTAAPGEPTGDQADQSAQPTPAEAVDDERPTAEQPDVDVPPEGASVDRIMKAHFNDALLIRKAVIAGKSEEAADPAYVIASIQDLDKLPNGWRPFVENMQQTAKRINNSTTASAAAGAVADLGVSCGLCHQRLGGPKPAVAPPPPTGTTVEMRMQQHIWATERLWEGLAVPSGQAWEAGAKALSSDPFPQEVLQQGGVDAKTAAADFAKLVAKAPPRKPSRSGLLFTPSSW